MRRKARLWMPSRDHNVDNLKNSWKKLIVWRFVQQSGPTDRQLQQNISQHRAIPNGNEYEMAYVMSGTPAGVGGQFDDIPKALFCSVEAREKMVFGPQDLHVSA